MIQSMTGFGKYTIELPEKKINIELKSLNSKQLDLSIKAPSYYRNREIELRSLLSKKVNRGKMELSIFVESLSTEQKTTINQPLALQYAEELKTLASAIGQPDSSLLGHVLKMPEVLQSEKAEITEEEWETLLNGINHTINAFVDFRLAEGKKLLDDFKLRIGNILALLKQIESFEGERIEKVKERIKANLSANLESENIDHNRFEQELIYYLEKFDITEEKVRLKSHCDYFMETAKIKEPQGKKLGFITQEIGREINTIGSKSNHAEMQQLVVLMKDELEKIKEQSLNVL